MFLAAVMNTSTKTSITYQLLGTFKTGDIPNSGEHDHGEDDAKAGDLHQEDDIISPGFGIAHEGQLLIDAGLVGF